MTTFAVDSAVDRVRDQVRDAAQRSVPLRIRGSGTWLDAGRPVSTVETVSTAELSGIVAYVPGDLTMTVRAGTTLAEIRDATATHNQWLALDPYGVSEGTIGATTVTASAGPLATFFGTPRDLVLGVEFVTGTGAVARGGGRVVKNVAGFDLTRLIIGSWGSIGIVTEVTVRLYARPEVDRSFAVAIGERDIARVYSVLRGAPFKPYACEIVNAPLAAVLLNASTPTVLFRLAGNTEGVDAQHRTLSELGALNEIDASVWDKLRIVEASSPSVARLSSLPSEMGRTWLTANVPGALVHATPTRGIVRAIAGIGVSLAALQPTATTSGTTCIAERVPADQWTVFPPVPSALNARIKQTFDPSNVLNRGILGELA